MTRKTGTTLVLTTIACLQGTYMIVDGIHDMVTGSYIGGRVGPWAALVRAAGVNEHRMGPVFILLGLVWLVGCFLLFAVPRAGKRLLTISAVITLLYPLFGTLLAVVSLLMIWLQRSASNSGWSTSQKAG